MYEPRVPNIPHLLWVQCSINVWAQGSKLSTNVHVPKLPYMYGPRVPNIPQMYASSVPKYHICMGPGFQTFQGPVFQRSHKCMGPGFHNMYGIQSSKVPINVWAQGSKHSTNVWVQCSKVPTNVWAQGSKHSGSVFQSSHKCMAPGFQTFH